MEDLVQFLKARVEALEKENQELKEQLQKLERV